VGEFALPHLIAVILYSILLLCGIPLQVLRHHIVEQQEWLDADSTQNGRFTATGLFRLAPWVGCHAGSFGGGPLGKISVRL
jgi:hypothetical protein